MHPLRTATYFLFMGLQVGQRNVFANEANDYLLYRLQCFFYYFILYETLRRKSSRPLPKFLGSDNSQLYCRINITVNCT